MVRRLLAEARLEPVGIHPEIRRVGYAECNMAPKTAIQQVTEKTGLTYLRGQGVDCILWGSSRALGYEGTKVNSDRSKVWVETSGTCRHTKTRRLVRGEEPNR